MHFLKLTAHIQSFNNFSYQKTGSDDLNFLENVLVCR